MSLKDQDHCVPPHQLESGKEEGKGYEQKRFTQMTTLEKAEARSPTWMKTA
jgi:hypothetical protein